MKHSPCLEVNLTKIEENSRRIAERCTRSGVEVLGVTKGCAAQPKIVLAMTRGGISKTADSRLENIAALRKKRFTQNMTLLRIPRLSAADEVIRFADCSVNSEYAVVRALSDEAVLKGISHDIILMIDVGDRREGVLPEEASDFAGKIAAMPGVRLRGIGTNMGCYGGVLPTADNLNLLLDVKKEIESSVGVELETVSGGGTSSLKLIEEGTMPQGINQLRVGEGILLGTDTTHDREIPWLHQDAFILKSEVIELKVKPSVPAGETGHDAFGHKPVFVDRGLRKRAIVALGKQDVSLEGLTPVDTRMQVLGGSSDHMIVDATDASEPVEVGGQIAFRLNYQGLLSSCSSRYIKKIFIT